MVTMPLFIYGLPLSIIQYLILIFIKYFKRKNNYNEDKHIEYLSNLNIKIPVIFFLILYQLSALYLYKALH